MIQFDFGDSMFTVWPEHRYCDTTFRDGCKVPATAQDNDLYRATALDLGYGDDTFLMTVHHEMFHTILALAKGLRWSPTLRAVACGTEAEDAEFIAHEEAEVLEFQRKFMSATRRR